MATDPEHQEALLELLNTTPVVNGVVQDQLADPEEALAWQRAHGGSGTAEEHRHLVQARDALQSVIRGSLPATSLTALVEGVTSHPQVSPEGVSWRLDAPEERRMAVEAVLAWSTLLETMPGRLRACANPECRLFLLDRSKGNKARWCSMALCGNRMKARRHYQRSRDGAAEQPPAG